MFGDESLSRRPMRRIMQPLAQMGAQHTRARGQVSAARNYRRGAARHRLRAAGAQRAGENVRAAGRAVRAGRTTVAEPVRSRDHTEIALREFGADLTVERLADRADRPAQAERRANSPSPRISPRPHSSLWPRCWCPVLS